VLGCRLSRRAVVAGLLILRRSLLVAGGAAAEVWSVLSATKSNGANCCAGRS
jgi:hypothetical protein